MWFIMAVALTQSAQHWYLICPMLYACGSNGQGQLGLHHELDIDEWTEVPINLAGPVRIAGGGNHTVIIELETGRAFQSQESKFVEIKHPRQLRWKLNSAGWDFFVLVDSSDNLWSCKTGLGSPHLTEVPWKLTDIITDIDSGLSHTVLRTKGGALYGFGNSRKGQAGIEQSVIVNPVKFPIDTPVKHHSCGKDFTAVVLNTGVLHIWGNSRWFKELGDLNDVENVICGWSTIAVGNSIWGNNSHNQLSMPKDCIDYTLGSEHGLYTNRMPTGKTLVGSWGWGEHGNCPGTREFAGNIQIFGGCATSFVNTY